MHSLEEENKILKQKIDQIYKDWLYDSQRLLTIKYENSKIKDDYKKLTCDFDKLQEKYDELIQELKY